jgi:hypothetical protein
MLTAATLAIALAAHSPVVVQDSRERFPLASVASAPAEVPGLDPDRRPTVYGRVATSADAGGGGAWLQYWFFYRGQDQDRGIVRTGRHAGDWEMVQIRLDAGGRAVEIVPAQHSGAERCPWATAQTRAGHPIIYVAHGSHASYLRPGVRDRTAPDPNDEADGRGAVVRPRLVRITDGSPRWMRWPGRWGGARARRWIPGEQDSPLGPSHQRQGRWTDPDGWARSARSCHAGCDTVDECDWRENLLGGGGVAALAGLVSLVWFSRGRRSGRARD